MTNIWELILYTINTMVNLSWLLLVVYAFKHLEEFVFNFLPIFIKLIEVL